MIALLGESTHARMVEHVLMVLQLILVHVLLDLKDLIVASVCNSFLKQFCIAQASIAMWMKTRTVIFLPCCCQEQIIPLQFSQPCKDTSGMLSCDSAL